MPESNDTRRGKRICSKVSGRSADAAYDDPVPTLEIEELRKTLESISDGFFACDSDWRFTYLNSAAENLIGVSRAEAIGKNHWEAFPHTVGTQMEKEYRLAAAGEVRHFEYLSRWGLWFEVRCFPREGGGISVVFSDITERKRAEEAVRQSEERLRLLASATFEGIGISEGGRIVDANEQLANMLGYERKEILGREISSFLFPEEMERVMAQIRLGAESRIEHRMLRKDGSTIFVEAHGQVVNRPQRSLRFTAIRDITERKRAEQALLRNEKLASVGRMAATIAHEINNPLAAAVNAVYLAAMEPDLSSAARSFLDLADQALRHIAQITKQALGFYREVGVPTAVHLPEILNSTVDCYEAKLRNKSLAVAHRYRGQGRVCGVEGELRQIASNLVGNSIDALHDSGVLHLRTAPWSGDRPMVRLTIADNGSGISPENLKQIFEPFFTTKEAFGTGLGLWVTKELVKKHDGTIRVRSREGTGTVFCIWLPVERRQSERDSTVAA